MGAPWAALHVQVVKIETRTSAGREADAGDQLAPVAAKCAEVELSRLLVEMGRTIAQAHPHTGFR